MADYRSKWYFFDGYDNFVILQREDDASYIEMLEVYLIRTLGLLASTRLTLSNQRPGGEGKMRLSTPPYCCYLAIANADGGGMFRTAKARRRAFPDEFLRMNTRWRGLAVTDEHPLG